VTSQLTGIAFDGVAYGSVLFLISAGLSITMGLMNFANLAHGVFAMVGGYVAVVAVSRFNVPFLASLPIAFVASAFAGVVLERVLYRRLYGSSALDQVLMSIGLIFISTAVATWAFGSSQQAMVLPDWLKGQWGWNDAGFGHYRVLLIAVVALVMAGLLVALARTRFGAQLRAAVDNRAAAEGMGINVDRGLTLAFALGSGLAGLGGALGVEVIGLDPNFPLKFVVYFLLVVVVGGAGSLVGPLLAALLLGVCDVFGKYYVPEAGAYVIYALMVGLLVLFPLGLMGRRT
jgi:branched-chain amino acid transport system permease protein